MTGRLVVAEDGREMTKSCFFFLFAPQRIRGYRCFEVCIKSLRGFEEFSY